MRVRDAMHQGVTWCAPDTTISELARILRDQDIGALPVCEQGRVIGMVTDRDICCRGMATDADAPLTARDIMTEGVDCCCEDDVMDDVLERMESLQVRRMPVLSAERRLVGMLSMGDIAEIVPHHQCKQFSCAVSAHH